MVTAISAATGVFFAVLAGFSIAAIAVPFRRVHVFSIVIAVAAVVLGYLAFRAAVAGRADDDSALAALRRGIIGAFVGLLAMVAFLLMFRPDTQTVLAHALGKPEAGFTTFRLLLACVLLGFGTGFILRMPKSSAG